MIKFLVISISFKLPPPPRHGLRSLEKPLYWSLKCIWIVLKCPAPKLSCLISFYQAINVTYLHLLASTIQLYKSIYLSIYLSIYESISLSLYLSVYSSIYLYIDFKQIPTLLSLELHHFLLNISCQKLWHHHGVRPIIFKIY